MRAWSNWSRTLVLLGTLDLAPASAVAEPSSAPGDSTVGRVASAHPAGGDGPPRVMGLFANTRLGGYIEGRWAMEREAGVLTESGFELTRMALVLATNKPNPWPLTFGYHEVWHSITIAAAICHYLCILMIVLQLRA